MNTKPKIIGHSGANFLFQGQKGQKNSKWAFFQKIDTSKLYILIIFGIVDLHEDRNWHRRWKPLYDLEVKGQGQKGKKKSLENARHCLKCLQNWKKKVWIFPENLAEFF